MSVTVREIGENDAVAWDGYVRRDPGASGYHLLAWRQVIERSFGHRTFYLMARDEHGQARGVLPLVFLASHLFGRLLVSMPFVNYGGILADGPAARAALVAAAVELARTLKASHVELRHQTPANLDWPSKQHKVSMRLSLPAQCEALWSQFASKLRSQVRRAQKETMVARVGGEELLDEFYLVFSRNMRDLGTPVYGRAFFATILKTFPRETRVCVVSHENQPLAGGFLYGFRRALEMPWASSDRRYNRLAPNMLLYWTVLEHACREGFQVFDFGRSTPGGGTYAFKEQWGAQPVPLHWYYWVGNGRQLPDLSPTNSRYRQAVRLWQWLPLAVTRAVGPSVVKFIP